MHKEMGTTQTLSTSHTLLMHKILPTTVYICFPPVHPHPKKKKMPSLFFHLGCLPGKETTKEKKYIYFDQDTIRLHSWLRWELS